jgi:hypothetical protein
VARLCLAAQVSLKIACDPYTNLDFEGNQHRCGPASEGSGLLCVGKALSSINAEPEENDPSEIRNGFQTICSADRRFEAFLLVLLSRFRNSTPI